MLYSIVHDTTERWQAEEALRALNVELEQRAAERTAELQRANEEFQRSHLLFYSTSALAKYRRRTPQEKAPVRGETQYQQSASRAPFLMLPEIEPARDPQVSILQW